MGWRNPKASACIYHIVHFAAVHGGGGRGERLLLFCFLMGNRILFPREDLCRGLGYLWISLGIYTLTIALGVDRAFHKGDLRVTVRMMVRVLDPLPPQTPRNNTSQGSLGKSWRLHRPVWAGTSANFELSRKNKAKIEEVKEAHRQRLGTESYSFLNLTNSSTITATLFSLPMDTVFRLRHSFRKTA